jgi:hypothetical protein
MAWEREEHVRHSSWRHLASLKKDTSFPRDSMSPIKIKIKEHQKSLVDALMFVDADGLTATSFIIHHCSLLQV